MPPKFTPSQFVRVAALCTVPWLGCSDEVADRFDGQVSINIARFGEDERLGAVVSPGVVVSSEASPTAAVTLRASSPYPGLRLDNGTFDVAAFDVTVENVDPGADILPRLVSLDSASRRDARCDEAGQSEHLETVLAPVSPETDEAGVRRLPLRFRVTVPRCASYAFEVALPRDRERWVAVVIGDVGGKQGALDAALASIGDADYVHVLGGLATQDSASPFDRSLGALSGLAIPHGTTGSDADLDHASAFYEAFGQTNYVASVGAVRWLALETASGRVSATQFAWIDALPATSAPTLAVMSRPPVDAGGVALDGLRSTIQAGRLVEALRTRGVRWLLSSAGEEGASGSFAGVATHDMARASGAASVLRVEVLRPWPLLTACDAGCDTGERCVAGFCRAPCERDGECFEVGTACDAGSGYCSVPCGSDAECPGPAPACDAGWCALAPEVRITTVR